MQGVSRTFDLYLPEHKYDNSKPLVFMFHGHSADADVMTGENQRRAPYKLWLTLAEPNGELGSDGMRGWNDCRADSCTDPKTDDVAFAMAMLGHIQTLTAVDTARVYVTGTSNGGNMVLRLAMEAPQIFAAVAAVVAAIPEHNACQDLRQPISVLFMNGVEDPILPYQGGLVGREKDRRGSTALASQSVQYWLAVNRITAQPEIHEFPDVNKTGRSTVMRYRYVNNIRNGNGNGNGNGNDSPEVVLY